MFRIIFIFLISITSVSAQQWQGALAPNLAIPNQSGKLTEIQDFRGTWLVLYFYPKDETPGCTLEAKNFAKDHNKYSALGAKVVGVSLDSTQSHQDFINNHKLPFDLLADTEGAASKRYKVLLNLGITKIAKRQTFIVDPDGVIVKHYDDVEPETHSKQILADMPELIELWRSTKS